MDIPRAPTKGRKQLIYGGIGLLAMVALPRSGCAGSSRPRPSGPVRRLDRLGPEGTAGHRGPRSGHAGSGADPVHLRGDRRPGGAASRRGGAAGEGGDRAARAQQSGRAARGPGIGAAAHGRPGGPGEPAGRPLQPSGSTRRRRSRRRERPISTPSATPRPPRRWRQKQLISANDASRAREHGEELATRFKVEEERLAGHGPAPPTRRSRLQEAQVGRLREVTDFQRGRVRSMEVKAGADGMLQELSRSRWGSGPSRARRSRGSSSRAS